MIRMGKECRRREKKRSLQKEENIKLRMEKGDDVKNVWKTGFGRETCACAEQFIAVHFEKCRDDTQKTSRCFYSASLLKYRNNVTVYHSILNDAFSWPT